MELMKGRKAGPRLVTHPLCAARGISQGQLADRVGVDRGLVSRIFTGHRTRSPGKRSQTYSRAVAERIADVLGMTVEEFERQLRETAPAA